MKNQLKTVLLLGVLSTLLVMVGGAMGRGSLYMFTGLALVMNFVAYFFSDKIVLRMQRAREVSASDEPRLHAIVDDLSRRAGIPKPRVFVVPEAQPNAFATGRNPEHGAVAVTEGIMRILDERELRGVLAHELAHIKNRDILVATIAAAIATAISYLGNVLQFSAFFGGRSDDEEGGNPVGAIAMAIIAPIAATMIQLGISRSREYFADQTGAEIAGDPEGLASALEKLQRGAERIPSHVEPATASLFIVNPLAGRRGGGLAGLFSTHPDMAERIARLRAMDRASLRVA